MNNCIYISEMNKCYSFCKYGPYCSKHKSNYLLDGNRFLISTRFTYKSGDYLKQDLIRFYSRYCDGINTYKKNEKKDYYFKKVCDIITNYNIINDTYLSEIIKIQSLIRRYLTIELFRDKHKICSNNEDFYTFEELNQIEPNYFYSFKDKNNLYWGFDIRSLKKLFEMKSTQNPYTTDEITEDIIEEIKDRINTLKEKKIYKDIINTDFKDRKSSIKQKTVDLISDIELSGYTIHIDWFLKLNGRRLKELYRQLEDLWNYRLSGFRETKISLVPPDGLLFTTPVNDVMDYNSVEDLQELILTNINKFKNIENPADKRLGYMYFILCLSYVSYPCLVTHSDWITYAISNM